MKIGVYICECGPNIAEKVDIDEVIKAVKPLDNVAVVERFKLLCSQDGKQFLADQIKKHELTHLVVAACSPREHQQTFMDVCEQEGLNPYLFQLANIREQCAWITDDKKEATKKAIRLTKAAVARVQYHTPLEKQQIESNPDVLVIGGGIAGIQASLQLAGPERTIHLVEKASSLGGLSQYYEKTFPDMKPCASFIKGLIETVKNNPHINVYTNTEIEVILGFFGNFEITVKQTTTPEATAAFEVGAVVVATGATPFNPEHISKYGYQKIENVITALDFEQMNLSGKITLKNGKPPKSVAIIHCVGREEKGYCSQICCMYSIKFIRYLQKKVPSTKIINFYTDLCIPGKSQQHFYEQSLGNHVDFIRMSDLQITKQSDKIQITYSNEKDASKKLSVDMVILSPVLEPTQGLSSIIESTRISQGEKGFLTEEHEKIAPVSTSTEGVFIAGCSHGPKSIEETMSQAEAVTGHILTSLIPGQKIEPEVKVSHISESFCIGCKTCLNVCCYGAITFDDLKKVSVVNEVICRGCGNCVAACPSGAITLKHFTHNQVYHEVKEAVQ